jgi:peptidoglycan hydrolase CwlO-like protein
MTYVGKILVVVIMAFSLIFLGISTVVFTTAKNWRTATEEQKKKVSDLTKKLNDAQAGVQAAQKELDAAKGGFNALAQQLNDRIKMLEDENKRAQDQITTARGQVVTAQANAKTALDEADARRKETELLRGQKSAVEKQANEFKLRQAELNDRIRELERVLDTATKNNADLRDRAARFSALLRQNGLSDDISKIKPSESALPVVGEVKRVDPSNRRVEITIGSDDGLHIGNELYLMRTMPRPEYIGKITIISVEPDQSVGRVIGTTYQGKKIKEGDIVSSTIKPRI